MSSRSIINLYSYCIALCLALALFAPSPAFSAYNLLLHNADRFGTCTTTTANGTSRADCLASGGTWSATAKWSGSWGLAGGQYGQFDCGTCHQPRATNIKGIKGTITAPVGNFTGSRVIFKQATEPTDTATGFGNDLDSHASSQRICEICHTITAYHRYSVSGETTTVHNNNLNCTACHPHKSGFYPAGGCTACHGNPPINSIIGDSNGMATPATGATNPVSPGAHQRHAVTFNMDCAACHMNSGMPVKNGKIDLQFAVTTTTYAANWIGPAVSSGSYSAYNGASWNAGPGLTLTPVASPENSCSVYCHGSTLASGSNTWPSWVGGANEAVCGSCHGGSGYTIGAATPPGSSHPKHAGTSAYGYACSLCHKSTVQSSSHVDGSVAWQFDTADSRVTSATYSGQASGQTYTLAPSAGNYKTCQNLYCHSTGTSNTYNTPNVTPTWGASFTTCAECHGGTTATSTPMNTGSHTKHIAGLTPCTRCHNATVSNSTTISTYSNHVNKFVTIAFDTTAAVSGATYSGLTTTAQKTPSTAFGSCTNIKCHSSGIPVWQTDAVQAGSTPVWGQTGGCSACHGGQIAYSDYRIAAPLYTTTTASSATAKPNAHRRHIDARNSPLADASAPDCSDCHNNTTTTNTTITGGATHANGVYNVGGGSPSYPWGDNVATSVTATLTYTQNAKPTPSTCSGVSCHPTGITSSYTYTKPTLPWNDAAAFTCTNCHSVNLLSTTTYHHSLSTSFTYTPNDATGANYPVVSGLTSTGTPTTLSMANRECIMCHVQHNISSNRTNTYNTVGRSMNLRTAINVVPIPSNAATYTNTDYVTGGPGLCVSCHQNSFTKDTTNQASEATSTMTMNILDADFSAAAHNYQVPSNMKTDGAVFNANCSKCHNQGNAEVATFQSGTLNNFSTHDSTAKRLLAAMSVTQMSAVSPNYEEQFCFNCHSQTTDTRTYAKSKSTAGYDVFGSSVGRTMSTAAEKIYNVVMNATYVFGHPVDKSAGLHRPINEGNAANDGTLSGANRHVECTDCHDPHAAQPAASGNLAGKLILYSGTTPSIAYANPSPQWTANQFAGWTLAITGGTGAGQESVISRNTTTGLSVVFNTAPDNTSTFIIYQVGTSNGNQVTPAQKSVWGVVPGSNSSSPTWSTQPPPPAWNDSAGVTGDPTEATNQYNVMSTWTRTESAAVQGFICLKCHSYYAYGLTPASTLSGTPNSTATTWGNTITLPMKQGDKANEFNPNNLGYHPIFAIGKNQPIAATGDTAGAASYYNANWPKFTTGTVSITTGGIASFSSAIPKSTITGWYLYAGSAAPAQGATTEWFQIISIASDTQVTVTPNPTSAKNGVAFMLTAGLGNTFVPPWGPWSTMRCTDCHQSDTAGDPMGPHGSTTKYLLTKATTQKFLALNASGVDQVYTNTPTDVYTFCQNCHRLDVYGEYNVVPVITAGAPGTYSRQNHPPDSGNKSSMTTRTKWGTTCQNCHGGARTGAIHGVNLGIGAALGASNSGKRLLAGATWYSVTRSQGATAGSCWTGKAVKDAVTNCNQGHAGAAFQSGGANYTYDEARP